MKQTKARKECQPTYIYGDGIKIMPYTYRVALASYKKQLIEEIGKMKKPQRNSYLIEGETLSGIKNYNQVLDEVLSIIKNI